MNSRWEEVVAGNTDRDLLSREGVPDDDGVLVHDQQQATAVSVLRQGELVVNERNLEPELAEVLRLELPGLQLDHHVPELLDVEEQQVDEEVVPVDVEVHLPIAPSTRSAAG